MGTMNETARRGESNLPRIVVATVVPLAISGLAYALGAASALLLGPACQRPLV